MVPNLPPFTCPQIDEVIEFVVYLKAYINDDGFKNTTVESLSELYDLIELKADTVIAMMEYLRQANSDLRERQTYFEEENHNYEVKIEELEDLVSELRNQE